MSPQLPRQGEHHVLLPAGALGDRDELDVPCGGQLDGQTDRALAALPEEDRRAQRPGLIMAAIYRALLQEIEERL